MSKEILRSTIVTVVSLMFLLGSLLFLLFANHPLGRAASILLLCGGIFVLVAGFVSQTTDRQSFSMIAVLLVAVALGSGFVGLKLWAWYQINASCCQMPLSRSLVVSAKEILGLATFYSQMGQDKWVSETVFPGVKNGFFLDVGSGDGTVISNTKALEQKGWTGICVDPFPRNMRDRSCQVFKAVVFSKAGEQLKFWAADDWGGIIEESFGIRKEKMQKYEAPTVEFTTVTLGDILERAKAPRFIHYVSLDIEGGELHALKGFPFDKYQIGALSIEHNYKEPKRNEIKALMESHGYKHVHTSERDDFYVPVQQIAAHDVEIFR
jgi:FkbM family methyltransferase